jgi:hypothetical protein
VTEANKMVLFFILSYAFLAVQAILWEAIPDEPRTLVVKKAKEKFESKAKLYRKMGLVGKEYADWVDDEIPISKWQPAQPGAKLQTKIETALDKIGAGMKAGLHAGELAVHALPGMNGAPTRKAEPEAEAD